MITKHQSYCYADKVIKNEIPAPKYVIKQCEKFMEICDGKSGAEPAQAYRAKGFSNFKKLTRGNSHRRGFIKRKNVDF